MEVELDFLFIWLIKYKISKFGHLANYNGELRGPYIQTCNPTLNFDLFILSHNEMSNPLLL